MTLLETSILFAAIIWSFGTGIYEFQRGLKLNRTWTLLFPPLLIACLGGPIAVVVQCLVIAVLLIFTRSADARWPFYAASSLVSVAAVAFIYLPFQSSMHQYEELRAQYPVESLDKLLQPRPHTHLAVNLTDLASEHMKALEDAATPYDHSRRARNLAFLHSKNVENFVNSAGFGFSRMRPIPSTKESLAPEPDEPIPQPGSLGDIFGGEPRTDLSDTKDLQNFHRDSLLTFINPQGFGWLQEDRRLLAGFQGHHFRKIPESPRWEVRTIELVGLVMHAEPVVYVTANLPRMEELRTAPTRPLDEFETTGLKHLQLGETLYEKGTTLGLRMMGAIRAADACVKCHGGDKGNLLGAFSYVLRAAH